MKREIYEPYTASLGDAERVVAPYLKDQQLETIRKPAVTSSRDRITNALRKARIMVNRGLDIVTGRAIPVR
jgi:hypothetical protein